MADAKKVNPVVVFLVNNGEKLALGIAVLLLLVFAFMWFGMSPEDPTIPLDKSARALSKDMESQQPHEGMAAPNSENWQAKACLLYTSPSPRD